MIKILKGISEEVFSRSEAVNDVSGIVSEIIEDVKTRGDAALLEYARKFDRAELSALEVSPKEFEEAEKLVEPEFYEILKEAAENIRAFHSKQINPGFKMTGEDGIVLGQKVTPIEKVGLYVPGGTAAYPSTVLMDSIPAKIAGCSEIAIATPPNSEGKINPYILAAARIAGVDKVYKMGGAQAVAALAYGTETVSKVDKIVGPGNAFVAEAKRQVFGRVDIDMIAGPSEILIVSDGKTSARFIAADMLSQAEHDKNASAVLVTSDAGFAEEVSLEIERQLALLPRCDIARASIDNNGKIIVLEDLSEVIDTANALAPEHLELCVENPFDYLDKIKNAGSIFLGNYTPEVLGDYFAGPNHTLPTLGTARFSSPLSVDDFVKKSQFTYYTKEAFSLVAEKIAYFAEKEGLSAHARSAEVRISK